MRLTRHIGFSAREELTLSGSAGQEWRAEQRGRRRVGARAAVGAAERDGIGPDGWREVLSAAAAALVVLERARATVHEEVATDQGDEGGDEEQPHARLELRVDHEAARLATDERREVERQQPVDAVALVAHDELRELVELEQRGDLRCTRAWAWCQPGQAEASGCSLGRWVAGLQLEPRRQCGWEGLRTHVRTHARTYACTHSRTRAPA